MSDFHPQYLEPFRLDGDLYALPAEVRPMVFMANRDLLKASGSGVSLPTRDWDWNDVVTLAHRQTSDGSWGFTPISDSGVASLLRARGCDLIDLSADPPQPRFTDPVVEASIRWLVSAKELGGTMPPAAAAAFNSGNYKPLMGLAQNGKVTLWLNIAESHARPSRFKGLDLAVLPLPLAPGGFLDQVIFGYYISANAESPEACFRWLNWLTGQQEAQGVIAPRRSVVESPGYEVIVGNQAAEVYRLVAAQRIEGTGWLQSIYGKGLAPLLIWLSQSARACMEGADLTAALASAQLMSKEYIECLAAENGFADENKAVREACLRQADPDYPDTASSP